MKYRVWSRSFECFVDNVVVFPDGKLYSTFHEEDHTFTPLGTDHSCVIQQSTGKFDINGVEIFEGDIVTYNHYCSGMYNEVRDVTTSVVLSIESNLTPQSGNGYDFQDVIEDIKVIGHIFEKKDDC